MDFLAPLVRRELRIALRRRQLPKERFYVAASGAALVTLYLLLGLLDGSSSVGRKLHEWLFYNGLFLAVVRPTQATVGIFSEERRNQTLGLLHLTGMTSLELFVSKLLGGLLVASAGLLAIVPFLAVPFLSGGVSFQLFTATVVCLPTLLVFVVSISTLASVVSEDDGSAVILTVAVAAVLSLAAPVPYELGLLMAGEPPYSSAWLSLSPAYAPYRVLSGYGADAAGFLTSIVATLTWSAGCLILACAVLSRSWRNDPDVGPGWRLRRPSWLRPDAVRWAEIRRAVLDKNPFQWRVQRDQRPVERAYLIVIAICLLWLTGWCAWGKLWPSTMNFFITALLLVMVIDWLAIHAAARRIGEDRRDGMFELLLTTGLSPRQIVEGQLEGLRRQFRHLRRIVVGLCVAMMLGGFLTRQWNVGAVITYVTVWCLFVAFCLRKEQRRVPSVMWVALITGRPLFALFRSKGNRVQWIWIMFNLRDITRGFRGGMGQFPTGSAPELILVAAVALIFAIVMLATQRGRIEMRQRLIEDMRLIVQEPVPDRNDPRLKKWNGRDRLPSPPLPLPGIRLPTASQTR